MKDLGVSVLRDGLEVIVSLDGSIEGIMWKGIAVNWRWDSKVKWIRMYKSYF